MPRPDAWLDGIRLASPCTVPWTSMPGTDTVRFCDQCSLSVYNLSAMTRSEAEAVVRGANGGRLCAAFWKRPDGTLLTQDCPVGMAAIRRRVRRAIAATVAGVGALAGLAWAALQTGDRPTGGGRALPHVFEKLTKLFQDDPPRPPMPGGICAPTLPPASSPPSGPTSPTGAAPPTPVPARPADDVVAPRGPAYPTEPTTPATAAGEPDSR